MEKRKYQTFVDSKMMSIPDACANYALGKHAIRSAAEKANAICKVGKRILINRQRMDDYFDSLTGDNPK